MKREGIITAISIFVIVSIVGGFLYFLLEDEIARIRFPARVDDVVITLEESEHFTQEELEAAAEYVLRHFKRVPGIELKRIWYDDDESLSHDVDLEIVKARAGKEIFRDNVCVFFAEFYVYSGKGTLFEEGYTYGEHGEWSIVLYREDESSDWEFCSWGHG